MPSNRPFRRDELLSPVVRREHESGWLGQYHGSKAARLQQGDKGVVLRDVVTGPSRTCYHVVAMDKGDPSQSGVVFADDEIKPDA
jgi:hypothetical protein